MIFGGQISDACVEIGETGLYEFLKKRLLEVVRVLRGVMNAIGLKVGEVI